jgi:hypothetical protein
MFERAVDGVHELADCGDEDLQLGFAPCLKVVIESTLVGSGSDGDQGGHAEDSKQKFGGDLCL